MAHRRKPNKIQCPLCGDMISPGGPYTLHTAGCSKKHRKASEEARDDLNYRVKQGLGHGKVPKGRRAPEPPILPPEPFEEAGPSNYDYNYDDFGFDTDSEDPFTPAMGPAADDFVIDFHPESGRPQARKTFDEFGVNPGDDLISPCDPTPWRPFPSRFDYKVANLALHCHMNKEKANEFLRLLEEAHKGAELSVRTHAQLQKLWDAAADRLTRFQTAQILVPYHNEDRTYDAYFRPLMDWIREIVQDEQLSPLMQWDARQHHRFNGKEMERFVDEPWTADSWWNAQTRINEQRVLDEEGNPQEKTNAKPLALIMYADKNKLSSFGTAQGYPVMATIGNLPADVRNSGGVGGAKVVGWQPLVKEESQHKSKKGFVDFKAIVWHVAFAKILESVVIMSEVGINLRCGDGVIRMLYLILLALSADYEEQCVICLIRSLKGNYPCPRCMVHTEDQSDLSRTWKERSVQDTADILNEVIDLEYKKDQEALLEQHSLRLGKNVFMELANSDPFRAVCFDDLHFEDSGLWGAHLFSVLKEHFECLGRKAEASLDKRFREFPRWRDLYHPDAVTTLSFNDGSKHRDVARMFPFAAECLIPEEKDPAGYQLLKCVRAYVNVMMYSGLHIQTETTMTKGRACIQTLHSLLSQYMELPKPEKLSPKNWNFPKLHYFSHLFDDIQQKGVLRNFSTRLFEKKHGPLRDIYHR
ncbi:hypothetical protein PQX77_016730 [Marasmius sp. AFHP31]|nr:hypothetical protein PQX77_016730 [Marasmius sp. AFHP31]